VFCAEDYGEEVARILRTAGGGERVMPLVRSLRGEHAPDRTAPAFFPAAPEPAAALAGLHLYLGNWDEAHTAADSGERPSNYYWHAIVHRQEQEPDPDNAAYWFRMTGRHPVFEGLHTAAARLGYDAGREWDPFRFVEYCGAARPGCAEEKLAMRVQLVEWQLLFDYCARGITS
jgi:hypothetical protein